MNLLNCSLSLLYTSEGSHNAQLPLLYLLYSQLCSPFSRVEYLHKLFENLLHGICIFSPIYQFIKSFICVSIDLWMFILYFVLEPNTSFFVFTPIILFGHVENFSWFLWSFNVPLMYPHLFFFLSAFLLSYAAQGCRLILCISCSYPHINHFSKEPSFLLLENSIRNQDVGVIAAGVQFLPDPVSWQNKKHMYFYQPRYMQITVNVSMHKHLYPC